MYLWTARLRVALVQVRVEVQQSTVDVDLPHAGCDAPTGCMRGGGRDPSQPQGQAQV